MSTALNGYDEQGLQRLMRAVGQEAPPRPNGDLDEALEKAACATEAWGLILLQIDAAAAWDRGSLGVRDDGFEQRELTAREKGARQFLRLLAATIVGWRPSLSQMAADVHALVWGDQPTEVTWQDVRDILVGHADQPPALLLEAVATMIRHGHTQPAIIESTGLSKHQVEAVSTFLGVKQWREESKRRAAEVAVDCGMSAADLARRYSEEHPGASAMSERRARELMADVRDARTAA